MLPILNSAGAGAGLPGNGGRGHEGRLHPSLPSFPPRAPPPPQLGPSVAAATTAASQLAEAGDGALPPPQTEEAADSRADGPRAAGIHGRSDGEAAAWQQPLSPPQPMTSPEEKVPAEVSPEQLAAMGGPGPSLSPPSSLEPGIAVVGVGAPDA